MSCAQQGPVGPALARVLPERATDVSGLDHGEELRRRCGHAWTIVQAVARRGDVRRLRTRLMVLLHRRACPLGVRAAQRSWYVPGAIVGVGIAQLQAWWEEMFGENAPCARSLRSHLTVLERAGALVRSPGELLEGARAWGDHPPPRHPDTIHLLHRRREAQWWAHYGRPALEASPKARHSARAWWRLFGRWRSEAADPQLEFDFDVELAANDPSRDQRPQARELAADRAEQLEVAAAAREPIDMLRAALAAGVELRGAVQFRAAAHPAQLAAALRALAGELRRGRRIRNPGGWVAWAFNHGPGRL